MGRGTDVTIGSSPSDSPLAPHVSALRTCTACAESIVCYPHHEQGAAWQAFSNSRPPLNAVSSPATERSRQPDRRLGMDAIFRAYVQMMHMSRSTLEREQQSIGRDTHDGQAVAAPYVDTAKGA